MFLEAWALACALFGALACALWVADWDYWLRRGSVSYCWASGFRDGLNRC